MAVTTAHTLYAVDVDPITAANAVFIDQVSDFTVDPRIAETLQAADGAVDPTYVAVMSQDPRITFSTTAIATFLAEVTNTAFMAGIKIDSDVTHDGLECYFQKLAEGGTRSAGATHVKLTVNEGLLLPRAITASQGGIATLPLECVIGYDGTNEPIVITANQALAGTPVVGELFTVGPANINGVALDAIQSVTIDPGIAEIALASDGAIWPTYIAIQSRQPMITIQTLDVSILNTYGLDGTAVDASDVIVFLRKLLEGGTRTPDATAEHISFTIDEGIIRCGAITGAHGDVLGAQLEIRPTWDAVNAILVIDPAVAIT